MEEMELEQSAILPEEDAFTGEGPVAAEGSGPVASAAPGVRALGDQELLEFAKDYPHVDAWSISPEVWNAVKRGDSLTKAYDRHEMRQLRQNNLELQRQLGLEQSRNAVRQRGLGSMRSTGGGQSADSFLNGFNED